LVVIPYQFKHKDELRKWLWKYLSDYHLTMVPRQCFARIPSFKATEVATRRLAGLDAWGAADTVLISPDDVTYEARRKALKAGKRLIVPIPKTDTAHLLEGVAATDAQVAAMMKEISRFSRVIPLADIGRVGMSVVGALSVDRYGNWLGQGEVFGELNPALTRSDGALAADLRVALVDDMQIFEDFGYLMEPGDARIDLMVTKTKELEPIEREPVPAPYGTLRIL